ncbi:MAG: acyloxyacyl hydrolase, partial [Sphingobacteriales bacterium]
MKFAVLTTCLCLGIASHCLGQDAMLQYLLAAQRDSSITSGAGKLKPQYVNNKHVFTRIAYETGMIMPVDDKEQVNALLRNSSYSSILVSNTWDVSPSSVYSRIYRKPKLGIGIGFMNFRNQSFGKPYMLYGYTEIPINRHERRLNFTYGIGAGIAWNFNHYHKVDNPGNEAIGSSVNAHLQASFNMYYWLSDHFIMGIGTGFRHFSNGALQKPNAGINIIPLTLSLQYKILERQVTNFTPELPPFQKHWSYSLYNSVGAKQLVKGEPTVFKNLLGFNAGYKFSYKYRIAAGFDMTYTAGSPQRVSGSASNFSKSVSYGPYLGWEWYLTNRLYIPFYMGAYIHRNPENEEENVLFQRLGVRYALVPSHALVVGVGLKSHLGAADFIEFT